MFTRKLLEDGPSDFVVEKVDLELKERSPITFSRVRNPFNDYFTPAAFSELKRREDAKDEKGFIANLIKSKKALKEDDFKIAREFVLLTLSENEIAISDKKLKRIRLKVEQMYTNRHFVKCLLSLLTFHFMNREIKSIYNPSVVAILEDVIIQNIANFFDSKIFDYDSLFKILFICFELHASAALANQAIFSSRFLKFIRHLTIWFREATWEKFINLAILAASNKEPVYFMTLPLSKIHKKRLKLMSQVYELMVQMGFHFLRLPFPVLFDGLNAANDKSGHITNSLLQDLSREIESKIVGTFGEQSALKRERFKKLTRIESLAKVLKWSLRYLEIDKDNVLGLLLLSKYLSAALGKAVVKARLLSEHIDEDVRKKIWTEIAAFERKELELTSSVGAQLDERTAHVINMDVKRTNFAKFEKEKLQKLLTEIATAHPNMLYYQGMNCIGGYILNYCEDYDISFYMFSYLIRKRLEAYFVNNFARIRTLLYVAERLIQKFVPRVHTRLEELKISNEFFLSPLVLTVFTSYLQFIENYTLVSKIMDMFIVEGWVGFFQILVYIFRHIEKKILGMDYDVVLEFLNKSIYEYLFLNPPPNLKSEAGKIAINKRLIRAFEIEYELKRKIVDEYWNTYLEQKKRTSH